VGPGGQAPRTITDAPFDEANAAFSPDGRYVALESSVSGRIQIVLRQVAGTDTTQISLDGGRQPRWSEDGRAVYFFEDRRVMKVTLGNAALASGKPEVVLSRADARPVAITPAGRVLLDRHPPADTAVIALNWLTELRARLPLPVNAPR
jgi:dipeptidyl aminopeptidase/acylaminoacyl peptidase